jgi:hypothetical protein
MTKVIIKSNPIGSRNYSRARKRKCNVRADFYLTLIKDLLSLASIVQLWTFASSYFLVP